MGIGSAPTASAADDGNLRMEGAVTYELQPDESRVRVTVELALTNLLRTYTRSDGVTVIPVYTSVSVPVPAELTNVSAQRVGGGSLSTHTEDFEEPDPQWQALVVNLSPDLRNGSPQTIRITYDLPDQPPRSGGVVRASPAYTVFPIYAMGDPEHASVTVIAPDVYDELELVGGAMNRSVDDGTITYTADDISEEFYATLAARNDDLLDERAVSSGDYTFVLRYTPGDDEWADFAEDVVSRGVVLLEQSIGEPWPGDADMAIIESSSPHAFGYAGWFDKESNSIEVSDELDPVVMLHELAHAWFNHDTLSERWLREGLADLYADLAVHRMSGWVPLLDAGPSESDETVALAEWDDSSIGLRTVDEYGYQTSWWAMDRIYDDLGRDAMAEVLTAAFAYETPYASASGERERVRGPLNWGRMLDLLEEVGGSQTAREVYEELVLDEAGLGELGERDDARAAYDQLVAAAGEWGAPFEVRRALTTWTFPRVASLVAESEQVLGYRDDVLDALGHLGVDELPELAAEYETSDRLDDTIELGMEYVEAADVVLTAEERPEGAMGALTWVGEQLIPTELVVTDAAAHVAGGELVEARELTDEINEYLDRAPMFAGIVLGQVLICLVLLPWIMVRHRRRRRRLRAPGAAPVEADVLAGSAPSPTAG